MTKKQADANLEMVLWASPPFIETPGGGVILTQLQEQGFSFRILKKWDGTDESLAFFRVFRFNEEEPYMFVRATLPMIRQWCNSPGSLEQFMELILQETESRDDSSSSLSPSPRVVIMLEDCSSLARSPTDRNAYENALLYIQLDSPYFYFETKSPTETGAFLVSCMKSLAIRPYFHNSTTYLGHISRTTIGAEMRANLPKEKQTWVKMLMQFSNVSENVAMAIVLKYPTYSSLLEKYHSYSSSIEEKEALLASIPVVSSSSSGRTRTVGQKLSKTIYRFFVTMDGDMDAKLL